MTERSAVHFAVTTTATDDAVDRTHAEIARLWRRRPDVAVEDRHRFESGLVEVVGNVVQHAYDPDAHGGPLLVEVDVTSTALSAVVWDAGGPPSVVLDQVSLPETLAETGRGLALAAAVLDGLEHERVDDRNRWTLRCERAT